MSATADLISPERYATRKAEIRNELAEAEARHRAAALAAAQGRISDEELQQASSAVASANSKLSGWDAAYAESQRLKAEQTQECGLKARAKAAQKCRALVARREKEFTAIVDGLMALAARLRGFNDAIEEFTATARPHRECFSPSDPRIATERLGDLISLARETQRERDFLMAVLHEIGFEVFGIGAADAWMRKRDAGLDVAKLNATRSGELLSRIECIDPNSPAGE